MSYENNYQWQRRRDINQLLTFSLVKPVRQKNRPKKAGILGFPSHTSDPRVEEYREGTCQEHAFLSCSFLADRSTILKTVNGFF